MKLHATLFLLLLFVGTACKKSNMEFGSGYDKSLRAWNSFKAASNNNYRYAVTTSSWTGYSAETIITVENGKVTKRVHSSVIRDANNAFVPYKSWEESASTLNTNTDGAAPLTLDEIYARAKSEWLTKRKDAQHYFDTHNNGIIATCGYREKNCADDCFIGINIKYVEAL